MNCDQKIFYFAVHLTGKDASPGQADVCFVTSLADLAMFYLLIYFEEGDTILSPAIVLTNHH